MSSVIFQPLLNDPLGWKTVSSTYADTFTWKKHRITMKDKKISPYGQEYQKKMRKQKQEHNLQPTNACLSSAKSEEQLVERVTSARKNDENRGTPPVSYRYSPSKTPPVTLDDSSVPVVESKQRPASTNRESTSSSKSLRRTPTAPAAIEEISRPITSSESRRSSREEKEKNSVDPNNDNNRHWLTFPNPKTPQYLIDIKQRLGQLKVPSTLARPTSACNVSPERQKQTFQAVQRSESSNCHRQQKQPTEQRHFLDFNLPETPAELRAARHRIDKHRYNPSLDNYPLRPQTCPVRTTNDIPKPSTPPITHETELDQLPVIETTAPIKNDVWITNNEESKPIENERSSIVIQSADVDGLPNEYVEAVEIANKAQEEYQNNLKTNDEKKSDNCIYRLPAMSIENNNNHDNDSLIVYRNKQRSTTPVESHSTGRTDFGTWVRNATDKERESAMKLLHDVLNQPIMGYDIPAKQPTLLKQGGSIPSTVRTNSASRKLGRVRTHPRISCDVCEKNLIKRHLWGLSQSDTLACPHHNQTIKQPIIQVRTS